MSRTIAVLLLVVSLPCLAEDVWWPDATVAEEMDLPLSTEGGLEIRVWTGAGITRPYSLYRIWQSPEGVSGSRIAWQEVSRAIDGVYTEKDARRQTAKSRHFLEKHYCEAPVRQSEHFMWCEWPIDRTVHWDVLLGDLLPEQLWLLPTEVVRDCGWTKADGEAVGIEIIQGDRRHAVAYGNPDFCCPDIACAIANHVRFVLVENTR